MKKIIAFGASSSKHSINKALATYTAHQINDAHVTILDLNDYEMPIYSIDKENNAGIPQLAKDFKQHVKNSDGIIISFAEHNGAYSTAFKNIFDWVSRIEKSPWDNKPMLLMATSPGARGGQTVLEIATNKFKHMNDNEILSFSLPSFHDNFSQEEGIKNQELKTKHQAIIEQFSTLINK
jgi:NAD(P)H-dependent FMN reductase